MLLAVSDEVWLALITTMGTVATAYLAWLTHRQGTTNRVLQEQNVTTQQNKEDTDKKLETIKDEMVHTASELVKTEAIAKAKEVVASDELAQKVAEKVITKITDIPPAPSLAKGIVEVGK